MALNTIATAAIFQQELDKQAMEGLTSSFMDDNAGQIIYNGGKEIKIPKMSLTGLKDYDTGKGYPEGSVTLEYETRTMTMDRGTSFLLDAMEVDESNFVLSAGGVLGEFQRTKVIPEVDAYRYSQIAKLADANKIAAKHTKANIFKAIVADIAYVQDKVGESEPLVVCINGIARGVLNTSEEFAKYVNIAEFKRGEVSTKVRTINEVPLLQVPSDRMYTKYKFEKTANGGFSKDPAAVLINWIVMPLAAAIAVCKQDKSKIIDPDTNQKADAWFIGYRKYHDIWVKDNMLDAIRVNMETA